MWAFASALTTDDRDRWRRWTFSLALALALHGAVAAAVLSLRALNSPSANSAGAIAIDLAPVPFESAAPSGEVRPAGGELAGLAARSSRSEQQGGSGPPQAPAAAIEPNSTARSSINGELKGGEKAAPAASPPDVTAPAPSPNAPSEIGEDSRTASGGGGGGGAAVGGVAGRGSAPAIPGGGAMSGPIDTRITVMSRFGWRGKTRAAQAPGKPGKKSIVLIRPSKGARAGGPSQAGQAAAPSTAINAIGAHVTIGAHIEDRVRAALARGVGRSAIGGGVPNTLGAASSRAAPRTVTNPVGMAVHFRPRLPGPAIGAQPAGTGAGAIAGPGNNSMRPINSLAAVNGTGMARVGSGPGVIGGPARNSSGGINGTTFRLRQR